MRLNFEFFRRLALSCLLGACISGAAYASNPVGKIVFLGFWEEKQLWQLYVHDSNGIRRVTDLADDATNLWKLHPPFVAFRSWFPGGSAVHVLNIDTGEHYEKYLLSGSQPDSERPLYLLVAPDGDRVIISEWAPFGNLLFLQELTLDGTREIVAQTENRLFPAAWTCSGDAAYFQERRWGTGPGEIKRLDLESKKFEDLDWTVESGFELGSVSVSCDEKTLAVALYGSSGSDAAKIVIYREGKQIGLIEGDGLVEPHVARDGKTILYVEHFGKPKNSINIYNVETGASEQVVGPIMAVAIPIMLEGY